jgi:hypothetical protein
MSLIRGSLNCCVFETFGGNPSDTEIMDLLTRFQFKEGSPGDELSIGFCRWNDLSLPPTLDTTFLSDGWVVLGIRKDTKKVPKAVLDLAFSDYLKGSGNTKVNKKEALNYLKTNLLPTIPFTPIMNNMVWHKPSTTLFTEGPLSGWMNSNLNLVGIKTLPKNFLTSESFEKLSQNLSINLDLTKAPSLVPSNVGFLSTPNLTVQFDNNQKVVFTQSNDAIGEMEEELQSILKKGGIISKMKVCLNLEDNNYNLTLNLSNPNTFKTNPGELKGSQYDKLFYRLERILALSYILENSLK